VFLCCLLFILLVCLSLILTRTARGSDSGQVYLPVAGPILPTHPQLSQSLVGPDLPAPAVRPSSLAGAGGDATPWLNGAALVHHQPSLRPPAWNGGPVRFTLAPPTTYIGTTDNYYWHHRQLPLAPPTTTVLISMLAMLLKKFSAQVSKAGILRIAYFFVSAEYNAYSLCTGTQGGIIWDGSNARVHAKLVP
jgi:hypothetical protein